MPFSWSSGQMFGRFWPFGLAVGCCPTIVSSVLVTGTHGASRG